MRYPRYLCALAALALVLCLGPSTKADTLNFTINTAYGDVITFQLDSNPVPAAFDSVSFFLEGFAVTYNGTYDIGRAMFYTPAAFGGMDFVPWWSPAVYLFGPPLFSGDTENPVFLTGTFNFEDEFGEPATLTIEPSAGQVPEPGSMLLLGSGIAGLAARIRRKRAA